MKNIVHLSTVHPVTDIRLFVKECHVLTQAGYAVTVITPHDGDQVVDGVHIKAIPRAKSRLKRMTLTVARVYYEALQLDADLYHFHVVELVPVGLLLRARGKKVIYDIYEDVPRDLMTRDYLSGPIKLAVCWLVERLENIASRRFSALIAATPAIGKRFSRLNSRVVVVNNYPILNESATLPVTRWAERINAVAYIGAMARERGIVQMVQAMEYLPKTWTLELAGAFSPAEHRDQACRLPGWEHVVEHGVLSRPDVARLLSQVRAGLVLFHPEPNHIEAQPNKLFEYMAAGIPVIASDFPLWRELIEREGCGLLVNPLNPKEIAQAIEYLLIHPVEAEAMGQRGRAAVEASYNWEAESPKLLELYAALLSDM